MNRSFLHNKALWIYILKFVGAFCICYFTTLFIIGISAPGGLYVPFVAHYLDYVNWLRSSLLYAAKGLLSLLGYETYFASEYLLRVKNGLGVRIVYTCLGYGIMSFWIAFIYANAASLRKKIKWILGGLFSIWCINVIRISLLVIAANKHWLGSLPMNHHTIFNIVAYILIGIMIWFFYRSEQKELPAKDQSTSNATG